MLLLAALSPAALLVQPLRLPQLQLPRIAAERLSGAAAAAAAFGTCEAAGAALPSFDEVMVELNKPPITLNPFSLQPAGQAFFAAYGAYLLWNVFRPPNAAEVEAQGKRDEASVAAAAASAPFLRAAAESPGARKTDSGLIYEELVAGEGASPGLEQTVKVHYVGTLSDGTVFDSSRARGDPTEFMLKQVIQGWQEGLALMKPGERAKLTIPAELAYGPMATGGIPANSALCFDVELLEVKEDAGGFKLPFM